MVRFYVLMILWIIVGCSNQNEETLIKINGIKSEAVDKKIDQLLNELDSKIEYLENPPEYLKLRQRLYNGLVYLDSISANPRAFHFDSLIRQTKRYSNFMEEQADIVTQLKNSETNELMNSALDFELKKLKQLTIQDVLLEFDLLSFSVDEPIVLIETDQEKFKRGDRINGTVRLVMGSSNMKSTIDYIKINKDTIKIDESGKGIFNIPADQSFKELETEIRVKYAIIGRNTFRKIKTIVIE